MRGRATVVAAVLACACRGSDIGPPPEPVYLGNARVAATWAWAQDAWREINRLEAELAQATVGVADVLPYTRRLTFRWVEGVGSLYVYDVTVSEAPTDRPAPQPWSLTINALDYARAYNHTNDSATPEPSSETSIGWNAPGEWLEYDFHAPTAGEYALSLWFANPAAGGAVAVSANGEPGRTLNVPQTPTWSDFEAVSAAINLRAGANTLRVENTAGATNYWTGDLWKMELSK